METRSRKRAEASSAPQSPAARPFKRSRTSSASSSAATAVPAASSTPTLPPVPAISTRSSRQNYSYPPQPQNPPAGGGAVVAMDSSESSGHHRRDSEGRRRSSGKNHHVDREGEASDKGKEKEAEGSRARDRIRDIEKSLGLSIDGGSSGGADDDDSEGGSGILHQNFTSASSALQGLLRKLGAGLDDLLPSSASSSSHQSGRLKKILSGLRADGEEGRQVEALTQLCEMLSIGTEDSLSSFSVDSFVPVLVGLLNHESNPDIMLLAARALTHLCDVLPSSCAAVVHYGAVSCFCARLLTIEYMDLAEQSLQALKKISQEHPTACLRAGALMAVLSYLDFFSTGVQRVALSTAANMCKKLPSDAADFVMEAVPLLINLLQYHDAKVLDHASVCLTRIAEAFASSPDKLDELCGHGLVTQTAALISVSNSGQASLSTPTYTGLIRLLSTCACGSALGAKTLHLLGISGILKDILSGSSLVSSASVSPALTRPPEQIYEIVNLANELLPPLPDGTISLPMTLNTFVKGSTIKKSPASTTAKTEDNSIVNDISAREKLLHEQPELLQQFGKHMLPVLIQVYGSSVNGPIRHKCLSVIAKLMYFSTADMIQSLLSATNISSFLAGVLAWKDPQVLIPALQIAEILMEKLPGTFTKMFVREGVIHAIDSLIVSDPSSISVQTPTAEKDTDHPTGTSRSRRYRRRCSSNSDGNSVEESKGSGQGSVSSPQASFEVPTVNSSLRKAVSACAKSFRDKFYPSGPGSAEVGVTEDLLRLKDLCAKLNSSTEDVKSKAKGKSKANLNCSFELSVETEEYLNGLISEMLAVLSKGDGVSTFEFIGSGVILALLNYLSCGTFSKEKISEVDLPKLRQQVLKRFKAFVNVALPSSPMIGSDAPMTVLIQKLQSALSSLERFPVVLSHSSRSSSGSSRISSGLSILSQPFKLRLCRAHGEKSLRDYSSNVVLIDPLASLAAVEEFLWPRVQRSESGQKSSISVGNSDHGTGSTGVAASPTSLSTSSGRRHSTRSRGSLEIGSSGRKESSEGNTSTLKGKGKAVLKGASDENKGPQTRNAARRKTGSDKDVHMKSEDDSSSEDEELGMRSSEIDEALVIEEDDVSEEDDDDHDEVLGDDTLPVGITEKVHDVKLGDSAEDGANLANDSQSQPSTGSSNRVASTRGVESADFRGGGSFSSRGAMSFAAAAMAGLASVGGKGIRGSRDRRGFPHVYSLNDPPKLVFSSGGKPLNRHLTIYQAVQRQLALEEDEDDRYNSSDLPNDGTRFWSDIYTITYQKADNQTEQTAVGGPSSYHASRSTKSVSNLNIAMGPQPKQISLLDSIMQGELPCDLEKSNATYNILSLLRVLEALNQLSPRLRFQVLSDDFAEGKMSSLCDVSTTGAKVLSEEFINNKLTPKLARQIQDALALCSGSLPSWCYQLTKACPFLFPFETRRQFFYSTALGLSRALHRLQQQQAADSHGSTNEREVRVGRLQRQKVRVSRNRILDSATKVMEMYSSQKAVLEVEYFGEVGTGLGPTLEFYTLLSHELQKAGLQMWRSHSTVEKSAMQIEGDDMGDDISEVKKQRQDASIGNDALIQAPLGLFPRPWPPSADSSEGSQLYKVIEHYRLFGRVMAKALQDGRLLDIPLSVAFYKLILGQELDLYDILSFDPDFGKILQELQVLVNRKQYLEENGNSQKATTDLCFRGSHIEDLYLDFTLPGYQDYLLKQGQENTVVDIGNLDEYISLVVDATVKTGISRQLEAFRAGFNQVFDIATLQIFSPDELDCLLCGRRELWEAETLADHIKFDHGYTAKSPAIINLLEIMGEFTPEQQRAFCQFVTGAPRLPPGGLAVLNPKLTIVRKHSSSANANASNAAGVSEPADDDLPSVMTCANYLKLPPYSTKEIMYRKLLYAINEGQGSFDLS